MEGYDRSTYGDRFAPVYDDWYDGITDAAACADLVVELALVARGDDPRPPRVLELGVGTGRLAVPIAERGAEVVGLDSSRAMLDRLSARSGSLAVEAVLGDMAAPPAEVGTGLDVILVAYNTLFNLVDVEDQRRCLEDCAGRLGEHGSLLVEAFVPEPDRVADAVSPRTITADRVVLSVSRSDPERQEAMGQYVDITEAGISLRPWHVRWSTPLQLDQLAAEAGLRLADRWGGWAREPFGELSTSHVSRYVRAS